jgi:nucleoside-diphosphate-sugar epimerase
VRALARSEETASAISALGAEPVRGDLGDPASLRAGAEGAELAFHCAATVAEWGRREDFVRGNVTGTKNVLDAARAAGVRRVVHVGTESALMTGGPLRRVDERAPLHPESKGLYAATKAQAELLVRAAEELETVVVRPRLVWGAGDRTILPGLVEAVRSGRFAWIGGGRQLSSTTHVDNAVEGLVLGALHGQPGGVYFVTDGEPVVFRDFVTRLLATQGVDPPRRSIPLPVAKGLAAACEGVWGSLRLPGTPPVTRTAVWISGLETTVDDSRAREELGYRPVKTIDEGLTELIR